MPGTVRVGKRSSPFDRLPLSKARAAGQQAFRQTGTNRMSKNEERIYNLILSAFESLPSEALRKPLSEIDFVEFDGQIERHLKKYEAMFAQLLLAQLVESGEFAAARLGSQLSRELRRINKADVPNPSDLVTGFSFNGRNPRAAEWARTESSRFVTNMTATHQAAVRQIVNDAYVLGQTPGTVAGRLVSTLESISPSTPGAQQMTQLFGANVSGLTTRYEQAVVNRVSQVADDLTQRGITGQKAMNTLRAEADQYAAKLRRTRARTIARTETLAANNQGRLETFMQAEEQGLLSSEHSRKRWTTGPFDVCKICQRLNGELQKMKDPFSTGVMTPPAHPNCRCSFDVEPNVALFEPPPVVGTGASGDPFRLATGTPRFTPAGAAGAGQRLPTVPIGSVADASVDTSSIYSSTRAGRQVYDVDRIAQVHDPYVREALEMGIRTDEPTAYFMGGGSGAGKGTVQSQGLIRHPGGTVTANADDAKNLIPEYRELTARGDLDAAKFVHEESSYMAKRLFAESLDGGYSTVLDGTGDGSIESLAAKVADARRRGATRIQADYVTIDTDEAIRRAARRYELEKRGVPETVIRGTHEAVSDVFPKAAEMNLFDELRLFDNNGAQARLIYEKVNGREIIHDAAAYERFLRKNPAYRPSAQQAREAERAARNASRAERLARAADNEGVTVDEVEMLLPEVRGLKLRLRAEAAETQMEQYGILDAIGATSIPARTEGSAAYYDWFEQLNPLERKRLSDRGWIRSPRNSRGMSADEVDDALARLFNRDNTAAPGMMLSDEWLRITRLHDQAGAVRRGRVPGNRAYSGQIDLSAIAPRLEADGYDLRLLLTGSDEEVAAMMARVEFSKYGDEAMDALGSSVLELHGTAPYRMSFMSWEDEVRELESLARDGLATSSQLARLEELVPPRLDLLKPNGSSLDYEELYAVIVETARIARLEVPSYATIPWA